MDRKFTATVVRATGSWYDVLHDGETVRCRIRGRLRLKGVRSTNPVVVGDEVACEADEGGDYVIADILPRRNYVIRRASNLSKESHIIAANVDQALLMASLRSPETPTESTSSPVAEFVADLSENTIVWEFVADESIFKWNCVPPSFLKVPCQTASVLLVKVMLILWFAAS